MDSPIPGSKAFYLLNRMLATDTIIESILAHTADVVNVFTLSPPAEPRMAARSLHIGPWSSWLTQHGYFSPTLSAGTVFPRWHLTRIETRLRPVCKHWRDIIDSANFSLSRNPLSILRVSATTLLTEPAFIHIAVQHGKIHGEHSRIQISFTPSLFSTRIPSYSPQNILPTEVGAVEFRFVPSTKPGTNARYIFDPRMFFGRQYFDTPRDISLTFPYLSRASRSGCTIDVNTVDVINGNFNRPPRTLHLFFDSWDPSSYHLLPQTISFLHSALSSKSYLPDQKSQFASPGTLTISLPRAPSAHANMLRSWRNSHNFKRQSPTILYIQRLILLNMSTEAQQYLFFLANLVPGHIRQVFIAAPMERPRWISRDKYGLVAWQRKNENTDMDLTVFDHRTWERDSLGHRIRRMDGSLTPYGNGMREFARNSIEAHNRDNAAGKKRRRGGSNQHTTGSLSGTVGSPPETTRPEWAKEMGLVPAITAGHEPYTPLYSTAIATSDISDLVAVAHYNNNASVQVTERKWNAYPGERQAWTNLELLMVFSEAGGLREKEFRNMMDLTTHPANGRAKFEIVRREVLRHALGGLC